MAKLRLYIFCTAIIIGTAGIQAPPAAAQSTEERFQDLFKTAGYATAFGAALGAAFLAFTDNPTDQLRYVAVGASLGFIGGSIFGSYIIFSPMFAERDGKEGTTLMLSDRLLAGHVRRPLLGSGPSAANEPSFAVQPLLGRSGLSGIGGSVTLARF